MERGRTKTYTKRSIDTPLQKLRPEHRLEISRAHLGSDSMASGGKEFGDTGSLETSLSETKGSPQAGTTCTTGRE